MSERRLVKVSWSKLHSLFCKGKYTPHSTQTQVVQKNYWNEIYRSWLVLANFKTFYQAWYRNISEINYTIRRQTSIFKIFWSVIIIYFFQALGQAHAEISPVANILLNGSLKGNYIRRINTISFKNIMPFDMEALISCHLYFISKKELSWHAML